MSDDQQPPFEEWLERLYEVMKPDMDGMDPKLYCDPEDWRDYYEDGDSPEDTWNSEKSHW